MKELESNNEVIEAVDVNGLFPIDKPLDEDLVVEYIDAHPEIISMNEHLTIDFIRRFKEKLDWRTLSINYQFKDSELIEFFGSIHWKSAMYCQSACTKSFIKDNKLEWVIKDLQKINFDFMTKSNEQFGNIENYMVISEANKDIILEVLVMRIMSRIGYSTTGEIEIIFENGDYYYLPEDKLVAVIRDIKIESLENTDVIDVIRQAADNFGVKI